MKYVIKLSVGNSYVKSLVFTVDGIVIDYTPDIDKAAKVSVKEVANSLAKCTPLGKAIPYNGP